MPNFCGDCGAPLNPQIYATFEVILTDGTQHVVQAINEHHARNLVIYGEMTPGQVSPIVLARQVIKVHPGNIAKVTRLEVPAGPAGSPA